MERGIVKILGNDATTFAACFYNEKKVAKGEAKLLEMRNFGDLQKYGIHTPVVTSRYLRKKEEKQQLVDHAVKVLERLGYKNQPILVYSHNDTGYWHLHCVTVTVNQTTGEWIDNYKEGRKARHYLDELRGVNAPKTIENYLDYKFQTKEQFLSLLRANGYPKSFFDDELEVVNVKTVLDDGLSLGPSHESAAVDGGSGGNGHGRHTVGHHTVCLGHAHDTSVCAVTGNSAHNGHRGGAAADDTAVLACNTCSELELSGDGTGGHHARDASLVAHVLEQGGAVLGREHVQLHRVALAVEASVVPIGSSVGHVHADHGAFDAVVDVGRQHCAGIGVATVHKVGKGLQVLGRTDLIDTVHLGECPCCRACHHHHGEQACVQ